MFDTRRTKDQRNSITVFSVVLSTYKITVKFRTPVNHSSFTKIAKKSQRDKTKRRRIGWGIFTWITIDLQTTNVKNLGFIFQAPQTVKGVRRYVDGEWYSFAF